jgi:hypothetical protein
MKRELIHGLCALFIVSCSPNSPSVKGNQYHDPVRIDNSSTPEAVAVNVHMTSTGKIAGSLQKTLADTFTYPVQKWLSSPVWVGCPDYFTLTVKAIAADGHWLKSINETDSIFMDSTKHFIDSLGDTTYAYDTLVLSRDTTWNDGYRTLWEGSKEIQFTGSSAQISAFDSVKLVPGTKIYRLYVDCSPIAKIKGSVTGNFNIGKNGDSVISAIKTYYTKASYAWDVYTKAGGSANGSDFETGPAEETTVDLDGTRGPDSGSLRITTACTTAVSDSLTVTVLLDISRTLFFFNGDTATTSLNSPELSLGKAYFYSHHAFSGWENGNTSSAAAFAGPVGRIEGYRVEYVWNNDDGSWLPDSLGPALHSDTTLGGLGWFTLVCNPAGQVIAGKMMQDFDSFCPKGNLVNYSEASSNLDIMLNPTFNGFFYIRGFHRGTALNDSSICSEWSPAFVQNGTTYANPRAGEMKFILKMIQQ